MSKVKKLYDILSAKYDFGSYEDFASAMDDETKRRKIYDITSEQFDFGDYDSFNSNLGYTPSAPSAEDIAEDMQPQDIGYAQIKAHDGGPSLSEVEQRAATREYMQESGVIDDMKDMRKEARKEKRKSLLQTLGTTAMLAEGIVTDEVAEANQQQAEEYRQNKVIAQTLDEALDKARAGEVDGFGEGIAKGALGFWDSATRAATWDFGVSDAINGMTIYQILQKYEEDPESLTATEQRVLDAMGMATAIQEAYQDQLGIGYAVGESLPVSMGFMASMALNPASGMGKAAARHAVRRYGRNSIAKNLARVGGDIAETAIMTATTGAGRVAADALERINGRATYDIDPDTGMVLYGGQEDQVEVGTAMMKAIGANFIENYTEAVGNYMDFDPLYGMMKGVAEKGLRKVNLNKWADALTDVDPTTMSSMMRNFKEKVKFDGVLGEIMEEEIGMAMNALFVGDNKWSDFLDAETQATTILSCAIMSAALNSVGGVQYGKARKAYEQNVANAERAAQSALGDEFANLRERIDFGSPEDVVDVFNEVYQSQDYTLEQKRKLMEYATARVSLQYFNTTEQKARRELLVSEQNVRDAYDAGRAAQLPSFYNIEQEYENAEDAINERENKEEIWDAIAAINRAPAGEVHNILNGFNEEDQELINNYRYNAARVTGAINHRAEQVEDLVDEYAGQVNPYVVEDENGARSVTTAVYGDNVVFVMAQDNGNATIITNDGRKALVKSSELEHVQMYDADELIDRFRQQTAQAVNQETEKNLSYPSEVLEPAEGVTVETLDGKQWQVAATDGENVEIVGLVFDKKSGQWIPNSGDYRKMTREQFMDWQKAELDRKKANTYEQGDELVFYVNGEPIDAEITGIDPEGNYYVHVSNLVDGLDKAVSDVYTAEELRKLTTPSSKVSEKMTENESTPTGEIKQSVSEEVTNGQVEDTVTEPTAEVAESVNTALSRVPKDEKGNPIYEQTDADTAWDAIMEQTEGDAEMAQRIAEEMVADKKDALAKMQKGKPKKGATVAEKIANEKAHIAAIAQAEQEVAAWEKIAQTEARRREAAMSEADRYAAEMEQKNISEGLSALGEPQSLQEYVLARLAGGAYKLRWNDKENGTKGFGSHTGLSTEEMKARLSMVDNKNGLTPEEIAHDIVENMDASFGEVDVMDVTDMVIDAVSTYASRRAMLNGMVASRTELIRQQEIAEQEAKDAWYMEQYHATEEELAAYNEWLNEETQEFLADEEEYERRIINFAEQLADYDNEGTDASLLRAAAQREGDGPVAEGSSSVGEAERTDNSREVLGNVEGAAAEDDGAVDEGVLAQSDVNLTRETLENGDVRITNRNTNGEVATIALERDGNVIQVDSYEDDALFERTDYDANGNATKVTRYKDGEVVSEQEYKDGKRKVTANYFEMAEEAQKKRKSKKKKDEGISRKKERSEQRVRRIRGDVQRRAEEYAQQTGWTDRLTEQRQRRLVDELRRATDSEIADFRAKTEERLAAGDRVKAMQRMLDVLDMYEQSGEKQSLLGGIVIGEPVSIEQVVELFERFNKDVRVARLFERVLSIAKKIKPTITFEILDDTVSGDFLLRDNSLRLNAHILNSEYLTDQEKASDITHELLHAAVQYVVDAKERLNNQEALGIEIDNHMLDVAQSLINIYNKVHNNDLLKGEYGTKDVHEFISELADPEFRKKLEQIHFAKRNMWQRIKDVIARLLSRYTDIYDSSAYGQAREALDYLLDNFNGHAYEQARELSSGSKEARAYHGSGADDAAYMAAVERGDMETAQRMVDEAARKAMKKTKVVDKDKQPMLMSHHTDAEGFYVFDRGKIGTGQGQAFLGAGFNFSRGSGSSVYGSRNIQAYLDARKPLRSDRNTLSIYQIEQIIKELNAISGDNIEYNFADNISRAARNIYEYGGDLDTYASLCTAYYGDTRDVLEVFEKLGFDSTIEYGDDKRIMNVVVFNSHQIKSAGPVTYDDNGNVIPLSERFNLKEEDIRFRDGAPFFSNAERAVENIKQQKATPEQWLAMIKKDGGLKAGEDKWMGLSDWLNEQKAHGVKTLTKDEVLAFIRENQIEIEEVEYASNHDYGYDEDYNEIAEEIDDAWDDYEFEARREIVSYGEYEEYDDVPMEQVQGIVREKIKDMYGDGIFDHIEIDENGNVFVLGNTKPINSTRLDYTTEGLDNKREIALVVPTIESWNQSDNIHFGDAGEGRAVAWVRFGETTDEDGNRVLVIDEVQSKRHDEGRAKGYSDLRDYDKKMVALEEEAAELLSRRNKLIKVLDEKYGGFTKYLKHSFDGQRTSLVPNPSVMTAEEIKEWNETSQDSIREREDELKKLKRGVPDAPFDKNYHELVMKRMLRYAAENGFDKVAWTKGAQQAKRYGLNKVVDTIDASNFSSDTERDVRLTYTNEQQDNLLVRMSDGVVVKGDINGSSVEGQKLSDIIGKDAADKLLSTTDDMEIKGDGLNFGGEDRNALYDEMIPRFMNKYTKKWGTKVGEVTLPGVEKAGRTMWSVDVTPEMKESVMQGQPMFRGGDGAYTDKEVSFYNDPIAKWTGKPRYYGKKAAAFAERERARMQKGTEEVAKALGVEVEIITDASTLKGRRAKAKGWYDITNKKVVVVIPNHVSKWDAVQTVLHEGVAHHGLRELFGDGFDNMLDNVYNNVAPELKARIDAIAERTGVDTRVATEEYLARLFEDGEFEYAQKRGWWHEIKRFFLDMFRNLGLKDAKVGVLTDNELRFILWRSYKNLTEPNYYAKPLGYLDDVAKQKELKVGNYAENTMATPRAAEMSEAEEWAEVTMQRIEELEAQAAQLENEIADMEADRDADDESRYDVWEQQIDPLRKQLEDVYAEIEGLYSLEAEDEDIEAYEGEREAEKQRQLYQKRIDNAYLKAVREGDWEEATDLFRQYVLSKAEDEGIVPMDYGVGYRGGAHSSIAKKVKEENPDAIAEAAYQMSVRIPKGSILVPMPSRTGNATYTVKLAEAIAKATDSEVRDVLKGKARMSVYEAKQKGIKMTPEDLGMYTTEELPKGKNIVIIDNVIDKGTTALAAVSAVKGASVVAYAYTLGDKQRAATLKLAEPVTYDDNKRIIPLSQRFDKETDDIRYRLVDDQAEIDRLESEPTIKAYRAMQVINGELYPPMSAVVDGKLREPIALGQWEQSEERPDLADDNGRFKLDKGNKKSLKAAYNPYFHSSSTPLNDQFSEAQDRDNLVTVEVEVPVSEVDGTSGYKAEKAKDAVGTHQWKAGIIQGQLTGTREVFLTRWDKPVRIVPDSEVAGVIAKMLEGTGIVMPSNVVTPSLRAELEKLGVPFVETTNQGIIAEGEHKGERYGKVYGKKSTKKSKNKAEIIAEVEREAAALGVPVRIARSVDELPDEDTRKRAEDGKLKGYYDTRTGEVVVYEPNTDNANDAKRTVLHEIVGHKGLRQLIGEERYDKAMVQLMYMLPSEVRDAVLRRAERHGWNAAIAMDEYLAEQAERDVQPSWWGKVNAKIRAILRNIGFNVKLTDADVTYLLWRSRKKLMGDTAFDMATNAILKQAARKSAEADAWNEQAFKDAEMRDFEKGAMQRLRNRIGDAQNEYDSAMKSMAFKQRESWQDSMRSLKVFMDIVSKDSGKKIADWENAYMYENAMSSANLMEMQMFRHDVYGRLLKAINELMESGAKYEEVVDYMMAKHGLERNEKMARKRAEKEAEGDAAKEAALYAKYRGEDLSGLTALTGVDNVADAEMEAMQMVADFEAKHNTDLLWNETRACTQTILNISHDAGILSDEVYDELWNQYEYYIPLRGFDETTAEEVYTYVGDNKSPYNAPIKTAKGRKSKADDPIATIATMAESAIVEANRNRLKQRFLYMVERHRTELASVNSVWVEKDPITGDCVARFANIPNDATPEEAAQAQKAFEERMEQLHEQEPDRYYKASEKPNIPYRVEKKANEHEHQVIVKRGGKDVVITINGDPRVAQAINGLTNPEAAKGFDKFSGNVNRFLSANFTTRNPAFVVSNFVRDGFYTNSMEWAKEGRAYAWKYNQNWVKATKLLPSLVSKYKRYEKGDKSALDMSDPVERAFYEFMINGGETGYTVINSVEDYKGIVAGDLKTMQGGVVGNTKKAVQAVEEVLDTFGRWAEDTSRFAAFLTSREMGRSVTKSIWDAKEISVNFNKKGSGRKMTQHDKGLNSILGWMSQQGRNLYVFWNAGMQGLYNFGKAAKEHPGKMAGLIGVYFSLGMAIAAIFGGHDDDDEDYWNLPEYVRRNNICFRAGNKFVTLPLPIELRAIYGMGELAMSWMAGKEDPKKVGMKVVQQMSQVMPIDMMADGGGLMAFVPSWGKPIVEVGVNTDWTGMPIYRERTPWNEYDPQWMLAFKSTSPELVAASRAINEATNKNLPSGKENKYDRGWADIEYLNNPAAWEHIAEGYLGGLATMFNQTKKSAMAIWNEDLREVRNVPVISRFLKDAGEENEEYALREDYFKAEKVVDELRSQRGHFRKESMDPSLTEEQRKDAMESRMEMERMSSATIEQWNNLERIRKALDETAKENPDKEVTYDGKKGRAEDALEEVTRRMIKLIEDHQ